MMRTRLSAIGKVFFVGTIRVLGVPCYFVAWELGVAKWIEGKQLMFNGDMLRMQFISMEVSSTVARRLQWIKCDTELNVSDQHAIGNISYGHGIASKILETDAY